MKKKFAPLAVILLIVGLVWYSASAPKLKATTVDQAAGQKLVDDFAPWISAVILQKWNVANRLHPLSNGAQAEVQSSNSATAFVRFTKLDETPLSLVGSRILGQNTGMLLFTAPTEDGPIAFKVSYYQYENQIHVGRLEIADRWIEIEALYLTVDPLAAPVTAMLQSRPQ